MSQYIHANKLTTQIISRMIPKAAIISYVGEGSLSGESYVEVRKINENGVMGAGMPVTYTFLEEIARNYTESHNGTPHGVIPDNMLLCDTRKGCEKYIWYNPPGKRMMYFKKSLGLENGEYFVPGAIYVAGENSMHIYAFKGVKPKNDTELFAGPFFNTTNGRVCLGSANLKLTTDLTFDKLIEYWEKRFWLTEFSHLGGSQNPTKGNIVVVTKESAEKPFDLKELKSIKKTLKNILHEKGSLFS